MFGMPKHRKGDPEPTMTGVVAGMFVSLLAAQFVRAAWNAAQREGAKETASEGR
jgi:hypothetical protein